MRTNIVLDDKLVAEGFKMTDAKTKRELVNLALHELVQQRKRRNLMDLFGQGGLDPDYDYKKLRSDDRLPDCRHCHRTWLVFIA